MSAIAGVFSRRSGIRDPNEVPEMLDLMASRGPDGARTWFGDRIAVGHGALHATPEAVLEQLPLVDPETGSVIVADVRLDNRPELIERLGLSRRRPLELGDGRLILEAYKRWGEHCVEQLLGDFAFGIWDERHQRLFLARDHFGAKPFTYHCSEHLFAFASDSRAVVGLADVPNTINRDRVFDFLVVATEWTSTPDTFFEQVHRLPPAHTLTISANEKTLRRYWRLPEPEPLRLDSDREYEDATREVLGKAVGCRLRGRNDVGVMLSGGIDSSAVAAIALGYGPLNSYSAVSTDDDSVESAFIRLTTATLPLTAQHLDRSSVRGLCGDFASVHRSRESLFNNGALPRTVFRAAANDGRRSLVTGVLADEVIAITSRTAMQQFLAERGPLEFLRLVGTNGNMRTQDGRMGLVRAGVAEVLALNRRGSELLELRRRSHWEESARRSIEALHLRISMEEMQRLHNRLATTPWTSITSDGPGSLRHRLFAGDYAMVALERYDRSAAACSVESRTPFMDRRVVEFFQRLPARQLVAGGWTKSVLRRSMVGHLPTEVVWSRNVQHLGWSFTKEWMDMDPEIYLRSLPASHPLHDFVDVAQVFNDECDGNDDATERILPYLCLGLWLENFSHDE